MKRHALWVTFVIGFVSCRGAEGKPAEPAAKVVKAPSGEVTDEDYALPALPKARITVSDAYGGKHPVDAEVAANRDSRTRGLMWRTSLPEGTGMIFLFPIEQPVSFWMKNTLIPLDMIFITASRRVAGCVERAEPQTLSSRSVGRPAQYVLEVPSGWCAKMGVKTGGAVLFEGLEGVKIEPD
jgi:uncharacterized membrane protein (UPF0127 family)